MPLGRQVERNYYYHCPTTKHFIKLPYQRWQSAMYDLLTKSRCTQGAPLELVTEINQYIQYVIGHAPSYNITELLQKLDTLTHDKHARLIQWEWLQWKLEILGDNRRQLEDWLNYVELHTKSIQKLLSKYKVIDAALIDVQLLQELYQNGNQLCCLLDNKMMQWSHGLEASYKNIREDSLGMKFGSDVSISEFDIFISSLESPLEKQCLFYGLIRNQCLNLAEHWIGQTLDKNWLFNPLPGLQVSLICRLVKNSAGILPNDTRIIQLLLNEYLEGDKPLLPEILEESVKSQSPFIAQLLVQAKVDVNVLRLPILSNHADTLALLLQHQSNFVFQELSKQQLMKAFEVSCILGYENIVKILLANSCYLDFTMHHRNENNENLFHQVCRYGQLSIFYLLANHVQDPSIIEEPSPVFNRCCLTLAAQSGNVELVRVLLTRFPHMKDQIDSMRWRPYEHAAYRGYYEMINELLPCTRYSFPSSPKQFDPPAVPPAANACIVLYPGSIDYRKFKSFVRFFLKNSPHHFQADCYSISARLWSPSHNYKSNRIEMTVWSREIHDKRYEPIVFKLDAVQNEEDLTDLLIVFELQLLHGKSIVLGKSFMHLNGSSRSLWLEKKTLGGTMKSKIFTLSRFPWHWNAMDDEHEEHLLCDLHFDVSIFLIKKESFVRKDYCNIWKPTNKKFETKIIGHRGLGMNRPMLNGRCGLQIGENTVLSMQTAARLGADFVEFDVQLTHDGHPVIFHDWCLDKSGNYFAVSSMTLNNFLEMHTKDQKQSEIIITEDKMKKSFSEASMVPDVEIIRKSFEMMDVHHKQYNGTIKSQNATFVELFESVKVEKKEEKSVGFNIEIKYPDVGEAEVNNLCVPELNYYLDRIINSSMEKAKSRQLVFSSFHTDAIIGARLKQLNYPVLFLTEAGTDIRPDPRSNSLKEAIRLCQRWNLDGTVTNINIMEYCSAAMAEKFHNKGLRLVSYGSKNNLEKVCQDQYYGFVDAVIVDDVVRIKRLFNQLDKV